MRTRPLTGETEDVGPELEPSERRPAPVVAYTSTATVTFEPRAAWGALPPKGNPGGFDALEGTVCHYTAGGHGYMVEPSEPHDWCREQVRAIQRDHQSDPDQTDISYNALACAHGVMFEGRVLGYKGGANGDGASNRTEPSICALVGVDDVPPAELLAVLAAFHAAVEGRAGATLTMVKHSQRTSTSCPGAFLSGWVDVAGYRTAPPIPPPMEDDDMPRPDLVQINTPSADGQLPTGAVIIADPSHQTYRWVTSEAELTQIRATFQRRGWAPDLETIPGEWLAQYGVRIGPVP